MNVKKTAIRFLIAVFALIILAFIGTMGLSCYVGSQLIHPPRKAITHTPSDWHLNYTNISFPSKTDSTILRGWLIPADSSSGRLVIEAHGYKDNRSDIDAALPVADALHNAHIAAILFDFRASGISGGSTVTVGLNETGDLLGAVKYARLKGYDHIGIIGYSMGASTALMATADDNQIEATIADSPFANLQQYLRSHLPVWSGLPAWPFTGEIIWEIRTFDGLDPSKVDPDDKLRTWSPRPLMLIAGTADQKIPYQNSLRLYHIIQNDPADTLWLVHGARHVGAFKVDRNMYLHKVTSFFTRNLK